MPYGGRVCPLISLETPLALGSSSPRRRELLGLLHLPVLLIRAEVDEGSRPDEPPHAYQERVVASKLAAARTTLAANAALRCAAVLVADTIVLLDDDVLGKPADEAEARMMLARLSGREHEVRTRFAIAHGAAATEHAETVSTRVRFRELTSSEVSRYAATGEGLDKAGAYAIQGTGSFAVASIAGSYANVVGLPVCEVVVALRQLGLLGDFP
jgi:septum formation protein